MEFNVSPYEQDVSCPHCHNVIHVPQKPEIKAMTRKRYHEIIRLKTNARYFLTDKEIERIEKNPKSRIEKYWEVIEEQLGKRRMQIFKTGER